MHTCSAYAVRMGTKVVRLAAGTYAPGNYRLHARTRPRVCATPGSRMSRPTQPPELGLPTPFNSLPI